MIQFNLLPDIKMEYIRAKRTRRTVIGISVIISSVVIVLNVILFATNTAQKRHIDNLTNDISSQKEELDNYKDLDKILTIQNQLNSLPELHNQKPIVSRLFGEYNEEEKKRVGGYIEDLVPEKASISEIEINFEELSMTIVGNADSLETVNKFADTLKFTQFRAKNLLDPEAEPTEATEPFSEVVLAEFAKNDKGASYEIELKFDLLIFDASHDIALKVPNIITTRSTTQKPDSEVEAIFQDPVEPEEGEGQE